MIRHRCSQVFVMTVLTLLFVLSACTVSERADSAHSDPIKPTPESVNESLEYTDDLELGTPLPDNYTTAYQAFLQGLRTAIENGNKAEILDYNFYSGESMEDFQYALFDMNGDGTPELHVRDYYTYRILSWYDSTLWSWHDTSGYRWPLDNGALLFTRVGGGPPHIKYAYEVLDFWGNVVLSIDFEIGDIDCDGVYDSYYYQDIWVNKEQWETLTQPYLSIPSDAIEWFPLSKEISHIQ